MARYDYDAAVSADIRRWLAGHEMPEFSSEEDRCEYIDNLAHNKEADIITAGQKYDDDRVRDWVGSNLELLSEAIYERDGDNSDFVRYLGYGDWRAIDQIMREHVYFQVIEQIIKEVTT